MIEKRKSSRKPTDPDSDYIQKRKKGFFVVLDASHNKTIGFLSNISSDGIKITSEHELEVNSLYDLVLILPESINGHTYIRFKAKCKWCKNELSTNGFSAGLRFFSIEPEDKETVDHLLQCLGNKQPSTEVSFTDSTALKM